MPLSSFPMAPIAIVSSEMATEMLKQSLSWPSEPSSLAFSVYTVGSASALLAESSSPAANVASEITRYANGGVVDGSKDGRHGRLIGHSPWLLNMCDSVSERPARGRIGLQKLASASNVTGV